MADFDLTQLPTRAPGSVHKAATKRANKKLRQELIELQNRLYAEGRHSVLIILQGMDASGKDGLIRRVFSGINPQGVRVYSFKEPTETELAHDFLWRIHQQTPARGMMQVFNRSQYEDVLITRVEGLIDDAEARRRFTAINNFEKLLQQAGTTVLKFYLHVSEEEQHERLQERVTDPDKRWKYEAGDEKKASQRPAYRAVYEDAFRNCSPASCPWHIVPADQNWYKAHVVAQTLRDTLVALDLQYPTTKKIKVRASK
ncbi:PPK2 family polyphosphate kinase [Hymenobacter psychrophilus]|uniref:Polyphosphate:nucleotide phosphotransferase, PPK2 family n=1 Tax=Hymenobacter psychrophilus TaxID=651662 RepID=A0A1H3I4W2_9BACT|nr:PPK2 family polyphosphate kinase [Hymenobacter psychrophilus]SDY22128.1 polyphosphate:nucleotide phosphotransferase, PPK2 family [Hymenobacter psychrophilus]